MLVFFAYNICVQYKACWIQINLFHCSGYQGGATGPYPTAGSYPSSQPGVQYQGGPPGGQSFGGYPGGQPAGGYPGRQPAGGYHGGQPAGGYPSGQPAGAYSGAGNQNGSEYLGTCQH